MNPTSKPMIFRKSIAENDHIMNERLGIGESFDVGVRKLNVFGKDVYIYYLTGLVDNLYIIDILRELMDTESRMRRAEHPFQSVKNHLAHIQVEETESIDHAITQVLSGLICVVVDGEANSLIVDVRSYPGRGPEEPDTERVVRGSRDGYTENIIFNTGLTRRRIRDERLRQEIMQVGVRSKTDVCLCYIEGIVDPKLVDIIKKELKAINIDGLTMSDKVVEEYIVKQGINPFPLVRYTERPDVAATHILEGHIVLIIDTSPSVVITPATLFHHVQHAEEYRQAAAVGTFLRWMRFIGILFSLLIVPFWLLLATHQELLPPALDFVGVEENNNIPIAVQIIFAEAGIELLRMAAIHTPSPLATALGLVAALLIGEMAIDVGYFTTEVILYVALGSIGMFATPSYELGVALRMSRYLIILAVALFGPVGFVVSLFLLLISLIRLSPLAKPYLWPFLPFDPPAMYQILVRTSVPSVRWRPSIVHPVDKIKQSPKSE
ncbi:stage V sporulation protein AF [Shouchella lehensis G1]|uniref:Stage V sporulation protein AF n=2 Tax=Shouchella lehensis TaxID=300825 RepID=A0A060LSG8_9BACI|nr:stage V sporulation protein AF [Shouchella lehensis G1]